MKNQGISLISLIITIIVVIILAAIAIFSGFGAVDSASLADFAQKYDNVQMAVLNTYGNRLAETAIEGKGYTSAQIYAYICTGNYSGEWSSGELKPINVSYLDGMKKLPTVSATNVWKLNETGKVVFDAGFDYKNDGKTKVYVTPDASREIENNDRATALEAALALVD